MEILEDIPVIDCDSHLIEPPNLWTSRVSARFRDDAPHVEFNESSGMSHWRVGRHLLQPVTAGSQAGWREPIPSFPPTIEETDPACYDAASRLERMDEHGIQQQLLFPHLAAFQISAFAEIPDDALRLECIRVYNDFQIEFASADPTRLLPQMILPIWDVDASLAEMRRSAELGHKAVNFGVQLERIGMPRFRSGHWDRLFAQAQDLELPIVFHIGFGTSTAEEQTSRMFASRAETFITSATLAFLGNANGIVEVIMSGVAHRYPRLKFVSIESGYGFIPYLLDSLDWQFKNLGGPADYRDWMLPSEYFRRQIYASFWFEHNIERQIDLYPDNVMFSSDFPHPTSLSPGPGTIALNARETIAANLARVPADIRRKLIHDNAARVYGL